MSMSKSILRNAIYKALLNIFNIVIPLIIGPYANRVLGPTLVGRVNGVDAIYGYFLIFAAFGIYNYGLREISRIRDDKEKVSKLFTNLFIIGLITNIIASTVYFSFIFINKDATAFPVFFIYGLSLISNIFYVEWATEAVESYDFITIKSIIVRIIYIILLFTLVRTSNNLIEYVALLSVSLFLNNIISFIYISKKLKFNFTEIRIRKHIKFLIIAVLMSNANVLYTQLDRIMLRSFLGDKAVGFYGVAQNVMSMVNALMLSVIMVTIPRLSNVLANEDDEAYEKLLSRICKAYFTILFPAAIGMFILSKEIIYFYGGKEYLASINVLRIFSIYMIAAGIESIFTNQIIYVKRKEKILGVIIFIFGLLNLISKFILIKFNIFTPVTAIATTLFCNTCFITTEYIYIKKKLKVNINIFAIDKMKYLFISLVFIPITMAIRLAVPNMLMVAFLAVVVNSLVYFIILYILKDDLVFFVLRKLKIVK